jgi:hypothetical protein
VLHALGTIRFWFLQKKFKKIHDSLPFKGIGYEADFPRFLHKLVRHRSLTLPSELFRFDIRIRGDIRIQKSTPRLIESGSRPFNGTQFAGDEVG